MKVERKLTTDNGYQPITITLENEHEFLMLSDIVERNANGNLGDPANAAFVHEILRHFDRPYNYVLTIHTEGKY